MDALNQDGATYSTRWDFAANGEVDQTIGRMMVEEWRKLLDANPYLRVASVTLTTDANGQIAKSGLDTGAADAKVYHNKIIAMTLGNYVLEPARWSDYTRAVSAGTAPYIYFEYGDNFQILPKLQGQSIQVDYNHVPERQDRLATDNSVIAFPDGYEDIVAMSAASYLLAKGGAEPETLSQLAALADKRRNDLIAAVGRPNAGPQRPKYADDPITWAG